MLGVMIRKTNLLAKLAVMATLLLAATSCTAADTVRAPTPAALVGQPLLATAVSSSTAAASQAPPTILANTATAATTNTTPTTTPELALPVIEPAPEWHNDIWINSEALTLQDLRGKVVLLEFWTFG